MAIEKCEHKYYQIVGGELRCSVCGAGPKAQKIHDKAQKLSPNKSKWKKETK